MLGDWPPLWPSWFDTYRVVLATYRMVKCGCSSTAVGIFNESGEPDQSPHQGTRDRGWRRWEPLCGTGGYRLCFLPQSNELSGNYLITADFAIISISSWKTKDLLKLNTLAKFGSTISYPKVSCVIVTLFRKDQRPAKAKQMYPYMIWVNFVSNFPPKRRSNISAPFFLARRPTAERRLANCQEILWLQSGIRQAVSPANVTRFSARRVRSRGNQCSYKPCPWG